MHFEEMQMNYNNNLNMRDLKKNLDNVRLSNILDAVSDAEINKDPKDQANKGVMTKLYINSQHLNAEEVSLLVDAAPNSNHQSGRVVCTWKLGRQFVSENEDKLGDLLADKLKKSVENMFQQRTALANGGAMSNPEPVQAQSEGFVSRLIGKLSRPKQQESSFGLG